VTAGLLVASTRAAEVDGDVVWGRLRVHLLVYISKQLWSVVHMKSWLLWEQLGYRVDES